MTPPTIILHSSKDVIYDCWTEVNPDNLGGGTIFVLRRSKVNGQTEYRLNPDTTEALVKAMRDLGLIEEVTVA